MTEIIHALIRALLAPDRYAAAGLCDQLRAAILRPDLLPDSNDITAMLCSLTAEELERRLLMRDEGENRYEH